MDLTVAICVYNAAKYIYETLQSLNNQTCSDFHLLIIDDCSTDDSVNIINKFFKNNHRQFELKKIENNRGIANARDTALRNATTKYLLFIDADDLIEPSLIETLYNKAKSDTRIMAVTCWSQFIDMQGHKIVGGTYLGVKSEEEFIEKAKAGKLFFMPIHTLFDRDTAIKAGGFTTAGFPDGKTRYQDYCEELDLWTRMSDLYIEGMYFATIPKTLYYYRKSDGLSSNHHNMILKMRYTKANVRRRRAGKRNLTFVEFYNSLSAKELRGIKREGFAADALRNGAMLIKRGNVLKGSWLLIQSIATQPSYFLDKLKHNLKLN